MTLESTNSPNEMNEPTTSAEFPVRGWWRILYSLFVVALPAFSFWVVPALKPEWQSGDLQDYLALLLQPEASLFFLILLTYSVICYLLLLIIPDRSSSVFATRLGIYAGVLLALQYSVVMFLYLSDNKYSFTVFLLWLFPLYYTRIDQWTVRKWGRQRARLGLMVLILLASVIVAVINREQFYPLFLALVGLVIAAPFWSFLIAGQAALWLIRNYETPFSMPRGLGVTAWLAAYGIAWRYDILKMFELYSRLPTEPPNCYIATAAAHGHPTFVGSQTVQLTNGESMQVNRQLQIFKCAELALLAVAPRLHKILRKMYDLIGKPLARKIQHPILADAAYLFLKPFEWMAKFILRLIIGNAQFDSISIYSK